MSIKQNLIKYMKERGLTIREVSSATGISEPTLKRLRTQESSNPTLDVLIKLSSILKVEIADLLKKEDSQPIFYQGQEIHLDPEEQSFTIVFTKNTFSFQAGAKAVFKRFTEESPITKYILDKKCKVLELVDKDKSIFRDENFNNFSIEKNSIFAYIEREIYEVSYV